MSGGRPGVYEMSANQRIDAVFNQDNISNGHQSAAFSDAGTVATNATNLSGGTKLIAFPANHNMDTESVISTDTLDQNMALNRFNQIPNNGVGDVKNAKEAKMINAKVAIDANKKYLDEQEKRKLIEEIAKAEKKLKCVGTVMCIFLVLAALFLGLALL